MVESTVNSGGISFASARAWLSEWGALCLIIGIALILRVGYMTGLGYRGDLEDTQRWMHTIQANGLFNFYATEKGLLYPPLATWNLGLLVGLKQFFIPGSTSLDDPAFVFLLKIPAVVAELAIIAAFYVWQRKRRVLCYSVAALLAVSPVMVATSAWWGQTDAIFTAFVVFALLALNRGRSVVAWLLFALAILTKQQSVVLLPLMLILSYRRDGWQRLARAIAVCAVVVACISAPFVLQSGLARTIAPYTEDVGIFPVTSLHALNFWYLAAPLSKGIILRNWADTDIYYDYLPAVGPLSYRLIAYTLGALFLLLLCVGMWRRADEKRDFVWGAAIFFGVFMLFPQMHERYIYPAAILTLIGVAQDRRLWLPAVGLLFSAAFNVFQVAVPLRWLGIDPWTPGIATGVALLNVLLLIDVTWVVVSDPPRSAPMPVILNRLAVATLSIYLAFVIGVDNVQMLQMAAWMSAHIADRSRVVVENAGAMTTQFTALWPDSQSWDVQTTRSIESQSVGTWYSSGAHYLVIGGSSTLSDDMPQRIQRLSGQGATLLYETVGMPVLVPSRAVLWSFRPDNPLNVVFDDHLQLIGYNVSSDESATSLLLFWYNRNMDSRAYNLFVHILDPQSGNMAGQADRPLGGGTHPTDTWRQGEIVFESVPLPSDVLTRLGKPDHIQVGLYQLSSGQRASAVSSDGRSLGDSIEIVVP